MIIHRTYSNLQPFLKKGKVLAIFGPRQAGKTTLLFNLLKTTDKKYRLETGDDLYTQQILGSRRLKIISEFAEGFELIAVDEAHKIPHIGIGLKLLVDHRPDLFVVVTGSSSFGLLKQIGEPLTGRKTTLNLFPVSQLELLNHLNRFDLKNKLEEFLIYGSYPEIVTAKTNQEKTALLKEVTGSYLLKDILELDQVKSSGLLLDLLKLVAFQIGSEVSTTELAANLKIDHKTVGRYLDLLEKSFILVNLRGFSRNLRKEINKKSKYYFYDTGVRNALISNFNPLNLRNDIGQLWENFLVIERLKKQEYKKIYANNYFWRTWDQQEIDWVEERGGKIYGFEFKWSMRKKIKPPKDWLRYSNSEFKVITPDNYLDFIT